MATELDVANRSGQDIYVGVNCRTRSGGRSSEDVKRSRCLFADFDHVTIDEVRAYVATTKLPPPTPLVNSGHGVHAYWRLTEPMTDLASWAEFQKDLIALLGSDPAIHDPPRIMRLPGFENHKEPVADCRIVEADPTRVYDLADLHDAIPQRPERDKPPPTTHQTAEHRGLDVISRAAKYVDKITGAVQGEHGDNRTWCVAATLVNDFGLTPDQAWPLLKEYNRKCSPPWSDAELRKKLESAAKHAKKPHGAKADTPVPPKTPAPLSEDKVNKPLGKTLIEVVDRVRDSITNNAPLIETLPCGWSIIDDTMGGLVRGEMIALVGGPGAGKTTQADQVVVETLRRNSNARAVIFSLETAPVVRVTRIAAGSSVVLDGSNAIRESISVAAMLRGELKDGGRERALAAVSRLEQEIGDRLRFYDDTPGIGEISDIIRGESPDVVLIDHLGLIQAAGTDSEVFRADAALAMLIAAIRHARAAAIVINEVNKVALNAERMDVVTSRGTARFASLAAAFIGLKQTPPEGAQRDPTVTAYLAKCRFGPNHREQMARFFGGLAYFAWGPVEVVQFEEPKKKGPSA